MKNCTILYNIKYDINIKEPKFLIVDPDNSDRLFIANKTEIYCFNANNKHLEKIYNLSKDEEEIVAIEYLYLNNDIVVATNTGVVQLINLIHKSNEEVTYCEGGIEKMSWSPDQEVVVFVTKSKNLVVMSCSYDPISESALEDFSSFGDGEFITVGWGKKETQFHGSAGKQAAKEKLSYEAPQNIDKISQTVSLSWRADGELFTVSFVGNYGRMFKVYNREGMLQYTSEKLNDLGECICWRPSGNWIGVPQNLPNKYTIGLFEKNGLRHREIILPFQKENETVNKLSWSNDSEILVLETEKDELTYLYFYIVCNYHWYLKYTLSFDQKISSLVWDSGIRHNKHLHILMNDGQYYVYRWHFSIQQSFGDDQNNQGIIAVIDGKNLLLTDFRNRIVPPPMSSYKYEHTTNIIFCGFLHNSIENKGNLNKIFTIDSDNTITYFETDFEEKNDRKILKSIHPYYSDKFEQIKYNEVYLYHWINENHLIFCISENETSTICMKIKESKRITKYETNSIIGNIIIVNQTEFLASFINGEIQKFVIKKDEINSCGLFMNEGLYCEKIECNFTNNNKLIGLDDKNNLYVNGIKISEDVTSFYSSKNYLAFTQLNCIKFYRFDLNKVVDERKIERGGKLVTIIASDPRTILQMPRGNLEVINPRFLSLEIVGKHLDELQYFKAFDFLRKQRINLNIIFDHNPQKFRDNIEIFLDEITNENWLNLFISELKNEDCTKTMYTSNYIECTSKFPTDFKSEEKTKYVCKELCQKMEKRNLLQYLLPIITTYVKMSNFEKCLEVIWNQKKNEIAIKNQNNENNSSEKSLSTKALNYLLYLVDVNELYNVALGMYDFGLVMFIAAKSQKDPKEYIPFLNELKKYEDNYRRFKIDLYLKKYEKALENISHSQDDEKFDEALDVIVEHKLYEKGLQAYEKQDIKYKRVCKIFADYLRGEGKLCNASLLYERADDLQQAILSAKHILDWKRCLTLTMKLHNGEKEELSKIALSLAISLEEAGRHDEAFNVLKNFTQDNEKAINCLINGRLFNKALYEAKFTTMAEHLEQKIKSSVEHYYDTLLTSIESDFENFLKYKNRLLLVRKIKNEKEDDEIEENGIDECDLLSDTTSVNSSRYTRSSRGTGKTFRSSKNRRKHERKLLSLKEGNPFEDVALIDAIHILINKILNQQYHIHDICQSFIMIARDDLGRNIQKHFKNLLNSIRESLDLIWIPEMQTNVTQITGNNVDYVQYQNAQHYAVLNPLKRFKPELTLIEWEHDILR